MSVSAPVQPAPDFPAVLSEHGLGPLRRGRARTLQVNVGKRCNQACHHCHVEAGPQAQRDDGAATPPSSVLERWLATPARASTTVDLTGGAPELNPHFRAARARRARALVPHGDRPLQPDRALRARARRTPPSLSRRGWQVHGRRLAARATRRENVEAQRGRGVFDKSIRALQDAERTRATARRRRRSSLDLVYNPLGPVAPARPRPSSRRSTGRSSATLFGVRFDHLLTLTNMPIKRFAQQLEREGRHAEYLSLLVHALQPRDRSPD